MEEREDLTIKVTFFKEYGKYYSHGNVNIGKARLWQGNDSFKQAIIDNQTTLTDSWIGNMHVVTEDLQEYELDPNYKEFSGALFFADEFKGMKRTEKSKE
ncbi:hypothetical protein [Bacillus sp. NPDC094106]|uniref:hypothetical protein n=1 Tax=Bacillus sp. NPDC094106 TaxID=3363949 RepID=UPI0038176943